MPFAVRVLDDGVFDITASEVKSNLSIQELIALVSDSTPLHCKIETDPLSGGRIIDCDEGNVYMVFATDDNYTEVDDLKSHIEARDNYWSQDDYNEFSADSDEA